MIFSVLFINRLRNALFYVSKVILILNLKVMLQYGKRTC